jgi:hypothetical protein
MVPDLAQSPEVKGNEHEHRHHTYWQADWQSSKKSVSGTLNDNTSRKL